ncbi:timeless protein-domain-containing protein [Dipodascopsis uninucleata]
MADIETESHYENSFVDPTVRVHVTSLISALGGPDHTIAEQPYVLGDDALACLRDLKNWIKVYDEHLGRLEVARTIAETSLVTEDLLEIMVDWEKVANRGLKNREKIALASVELLVYLTWEIKLDNPVNEQQVENFKQKPHIEQAQRRYKKAILRHSSDRVLKAISRVAIPYLTKSRRERTARDENIVKLVLLFFRNIARISQVQDYYVDDDRSLTILQFEQQKVLRFLLTLTSNIMDEFHTLNATLLDLTYQTLRCIKPGDLFSMRSLPNGRLLQKHEDEAQVISKGVSTRHNRFGTLMSVVVDNEMRYTMSGQQAIQEGSSSIEILDATKKFLPPLRRMKIENDDLEKRISISSEARPFLKQFVYDFLDSSFNPLFISLRKDIERESNHVEEIHKKEFLYLMSWFLRAELERRSHDSDTTNDFSVVAGVLDHQSIVTIVKLLRESVEKKQYLTMRCGMDCLKQIILVVGEMSSSSSEEDREIADNLVTRLFYEEITLDLIASLPRVVKGLPFSYLSTCAELVHVVIRILEKFSKENKRMYIRSKRRRQTKSKTTSGQKRSHDTSENLLETEEYDEVELQRSQVRERAFEFARFENKFLTQACIDMFRTLMENYKETSDSQLRQTLAYFHRLFFKREEETVLYRLDFMLALYRCLDPKNGIPQWRSVRHEFEQFMKHFVRKLAKALEERPALYVELLFTKIPETLFFLKYGHDDENSLRKRRKKVNAKIIDDQDIPRLSDEEGTDKDLDL